MRQKLIPFQTESIKNACTSPQYHFRHKDKLSNCFRWKVDTAYFFKVFPLPKPTNWINNKASAPLTSYRVEDSHNPLK